MVSALSKKVGTLRQVVRREGVGGVLSILKLKADPYIFRSIDYARVAPSAVSLLAQHGRPTMLLNATGAGIGDDLLCTSVLHEFRRRGERRVWIMSKYPELFEHSPDVPFVVPALNRYDQVLRRFGTTVVYPWYTSYHPAFDRDDPLPQQHLISIMCQKAGITGEVALRPYLHLTDAEARAGRLAPRQVAIQSSGLNAKHAMRNKNWSLDRYQAVVSALRGRYDFVQVGSPTDPLLEGVLDLRGKTSLRQTAAVLRGSLLFVGQVGFLMHLARAVDCRSVIVYGGRETPAQSGYPCNVNLVGDVPCSPCWLLNTCPYERVCLQMVEPGHVVAGVEAQAARHGTPLECDTHTITEELIARNAARHADAVAAHQLAWSIAYQT